MSVIFRYVNPRTGKMEYGEIINANSKATTIETGNHISVIPMNIMKKVN